MKEGFEIIADMFVFVDPEETVWLKRTVSYHAAYILP